MTDNGFFAENRRQQAQYWLREALDGLLRAFQADPAVRERLAALEPLVLAGRMSPFAAAEAVLAAFRN